MYEPDGCPSLESVVVASESRFASMDSVAAVAVPARKRTAKRRTVRPDDTASLRRWSAAGCYGMLVGSAVLNGMANAQYAPAAWAGWLAGIAIPAVLLVGFRVAAGSLSRSAGRHGQVRRRIGIGVAAATVGLLALSVWHCAESLSRLTGASLALAMPQAVAIDCLLVGCELAALYA